MALADIPNFAVLDGRVGTGGQPNEAQLALLRDDGVEVVINLGLLDPRYCLNDEAANVRALGMEYHHIPVDFQRPQLIDYRRFEAVMESCASQRVFVHCAMNYRVSCFIALFGERRLGWPREQADAWVRGRWEPNQDWAEFLRQVRTSNENSGLEVTVPAEAE